MSAINAVLCCAKHVIPGMLELYQRLQNTNETLPDAIAAASKADFYALFPNEQFEQLTSTGPFAGTLQAFKAGTTFRTRYERLLERALEHRHTSFWTSDSPRCIDTARYFATGFFGLNWTDIATLHIVPETADQGGSTLTPGRACPSYIKNRHERGHEFGNRQLKAFRSSYLPQIRDRFAADSPGLLFDEAEIYSMQEYCAFETLVRGDSKWCDVFTQDEWESFEYARDLLHYYRAGPGNPFAAAGGMLWLKATAELMLQGSEAGNLFFSFNHDGDIFNLLSALQLFQEPEDLPTDRVKHDRTWRLSDVTPMGARIVLERYVCPSSPPQCWANELYPNHEHCEEQMYEPHVRLSINDGIVPIPRCQDGSPGGGCLLSNFLSLVDVRDQETPDWASLCEVDQKLPKRVEFLHHHHQK
ncbi:hypothetical protein AC578_5381 [Pseudocercospora eumusae]|uniref:Acid phosphatase n=1 Tax=Pseudocercospora eumusae TaxID=321146 RepID=A0A139HKD0_9PEZI|nr:hypothetical protein AC578_5381 [Pseudocercospora eumusae]